MEQIYRCLRCRGSLSPTGYGLMCMHCSALYPSVDGLTVLVREPIAYLRTELAAFHNECDAAKQRRNMIEQIARELDLSRVAIGRHHAVIDAKIARGESFAALLEPAARVSRDFAEVSAKTGGSFGFRQFGWSFQNLLPYLMRDWTNTSELQAAQGIIGALLREAIPDPSDKTIAFAACGAAGLAATLPHAFGRVVAYDLSLPILAAARKLLGGSNLDMAVPHFVNAQGKIRLSGRHPEQGMAEVELAAMDALATAFIDGAVDCVVTSFVMDLMPDPRMLANEINRILGEGGIWINYGPYGSQDAWWCFSETEGAAFFAAAGFEVLRSSKHRTSYLDLTQTDSEANYQSHMCCATLCRKSGPGNVRSAKASLMPGELPQVIPDHFPGAHLIHQQRLGPAGTRMVILRRERIRGRVESVDIDDDMAQILTLVDGKRTVTEIAALLQQRHGPIPAAQIFQAFSRYFEQNILSWRHPRP
jgi:SAM-dependent methyltransferase